MSALINDFSIYYSSLSSDQVIGQVMRMTYVLYSQNQVMLGVYAQLFLLLELLKQPGDADSGCTAGSGKLFMR